MKIVFLIVYDIKDKVSFENLDSQIDKFEKNTKKSS